MCSRKNFIVLLFLLLTSIHNLFSQILLEGTVTDNASEPVTNALVEVIDQADSSRRFSDFTDEQGYYVLQIYPTGVGDATLKTPGGYPLLKNYPNPFNPSTLITCELPCPSIVRIDIYNVLGQKIKTLFDGFLPTSTGQFLWDATNENGRGVSAGVYLCMLKADGIKLTRKMLLVDGHSQPLNMTLPENIQNGNNGPVSLAKLNLSDTFVFRVSGENIETYEQTDVVITQNMELNVKIVRTVTDIDGNVADASIVITIQ